MAMIDYVYVNAAGRVAFVTLNYDGLMPDPPADTGVAGHVDITSDPDHDAIIAGSKEYVGVPPDWANYTPTTTVLERGLWWARLEETEAVFIEAKVATDMTVVAYLALLDTMSFVDVVSTGDHTMRNFAAYLKATFVGDPGFWVDNTEADLRISIWFA